MKGKRKFSYVYDGNIRYQYVKKSPNLCDSFPSGNWLTWWEKKNISKEYDANIWHQYVKNKKKTWDAMIKGSFRLWAHPTREAVTT